ncbi:MAG: KEOPS complex subunit Cgi121 [Candidatus Bathyarchaeia archaeon]
MIERIPEYGWFILVTALKGVRVESVDRFLAWLRDVVKPVEVQAFDAQAVAGRRHLYFAALFALKAFAEASNVSDRLGMEALLQASAQRQVSKAIEKLGVKPGVGDIAILLMSKDEKELRGAFSRLIGVSGMLVDEALLEVSSERLSGLQALFEVSERELAAERDAEEPASALTNLIIERMTLEASRRSPRPAPELKPPSARS